MRELPLDESARAVFNAAGKAVATFGPVRPGETWDIDLINIETTSAIQTQFKLYRQREAAAALLDQSIFNGNSDVSDSTISVQNQAQLVGVWTGGTVGAVATITVSGKRKVIR